LEEEDDFKMMALKVPKLTEKKNFSPVTVEGILILERENYVFPMVSFAKNVSIEVECKGLRDISIGLVGKIRTIELKMLNGIGLTPETTVGSDVWI
jgi:hypothetical protein